jgi:hypothetical protein
MQCKVCLQSNPKFHKGFEGRECAECRNARRELRNSAIKYSDVLKYLSRIRPVKLSSVKSATNVKGPNVNSSRKSHYAPSADAIMVEWDNRNNVDLGNQFIYMIRIQCPDGELRYIGRARNESRLREYQRNLTKIFEGKPRGARTSRSSGFTDGLGERFN